MKHKLSLSGALAALALFLSAPIREGGLAYGQGFRGGPGQRLEAARLEIDSTLPANLSLPGRFSVGCKPSVAKGGQKKHFPSLSPFHPLSLSVATERTRK